MLGKLYSNTLLVSLNNRISFRDSYEARGGVVDCQVITDSKATKDTTNPEAETTQEDLIKPLVAEGEVEERVNSECRDRYVKVLLSYYPSRSRRCRHCVMPVIRTSGFVYGLQVDRRLDTAVLG